MKKGRGEETRREGKKGIRGKKGKFRSHKVFKIGAYGGPQVSASGPPHVGKRRAWT